jgi:hypothetical protein
MVVARVFHRPSRVLLGLALLFALVVAVQLPQPASASYNRANMCADLMQDNLELSSSWSEAMMSGDYDSARILSTAISWNVSTMMALQC